jgi:hypothetical protein
MWTKIDCSVGSLAFGGCCPGCRRRMGLHGGACCGFGWASRGELREVRGASRVSGRGRSVVGARGATAFGCGSIVRFARRLDRQAEWGLGVAVLVEPVLARREMVFVALVVGFRIDVSGIGVGVMYGYADFVNEASGCGVMRLRGAKGRSAGKSVVLVVGEGN